MRGGTKQSQNSWRDILFLFLLGFEIASLALAMTISTRAMPRRNDIAGCVIYFDSIALMTIFFFLAFSQNFYII
jgi:hypothetical protein